MPKIFDWRDHENDSECQKRYDGVLGELEPWYDLVDALRESPGESARLALFERFLEDIPGAVKSKRKTCVFISHQKLDTDKAERIVCLADHHKLDYWVDVHSPTLRYVNNKLKKGDPRRSILIAAVIEIALLRCTHVIAVHTTNSLASRWVPYELARAKARQIKSTQAAGWFETGQDWKTCGDYVQLAVMANSEPDVMGWLASVPGATPVPLPVASPCPHLGHNNAKNSPRISTLPPAAAGAANHRDRAARGAHACLRSLRRKGPSSGGNRPKLTFIAGRSWRPHHR